MDKVRKAAFLSVGRAVGFCGLGIFTMMVGLSYQPVLALQSGGVLLLLLLTVLLLKALHAPMANYRHTEAWILLDKGDRPHESFAGAAIGTALRHAYLWFARWIAGVAALVWVGAVVLAWTGLGADPQA